MPDRIEQQVGNYRLVKLLGKGGFAEVYLGEHIHLGTPAAIKLLTAKLSTEEENHFREEARTIAWLKHPNIVRVLEFGVQEGLPYLVMDYAPNGTLRQFFLKGWKYEPITILPYVQQVASALQFAHDRKLVHRDVKPENMLLGENKEVLLSDFGIAVVAQSSRHEDVQEVVGTLAYMAPEQIQAHPRPSSDQYSLGVVVYEWLTGARPFSGSMSEILAKQISTPPQPIREQIPQVSAELEQVVLTALAKDPKDRFASVLAFAKAFEQATLAQDSTTIAAVEIPRASPSDVGQANNVFSAPSTTANSSPASNWPSFSGPSGSASPSAVPSFSASSEPYPNANAAPNAAASSTPSVAAGVASAPGLPTNSSGPYGPPPSAPADGEANILDAPTIMGTFLPPTAPAPGAEPVVSAPPGWQPSQPVPSSPPGWQSSQPIPSSPPGWQNSQPSAPQSGGSAPQPIPSLPPGWQNSQPPIPASPLQTGPTFMAAAPVAPFPPGGSPPPTPPAQPPGGGISRRNLLIAGAVGAAGLVVVGGGISWFVLSKKSPTPIVHSITTPTPIPTVPVSSTPIAAVPGKPLFIYTGHKGAVYNVAWSKDGTRVASAGADYTVQVWDAFNGANASTYRGHTGIVRALSFSPDGQSLASASDDKTVQIWNLASNSLSFTYTGHTAAVLTVAWSPVGTAIASGSLDHYLRVWNARNGQTALQKLSAGSTYPTWVAWGPEGKRLAVASTEEIVRIWEVATNSRILAYGPNGAVVNAVAWSPAGTRLVSGEADGIVRIWDAASGVTYGRNQSTKGSVHAVAWSPDGKYIATGNADATIRILDAATAKELRSFTNHDGAVLSVAWSPDGRYFVSAGQDGTAQVWQA